MRHCKCGGGGVRLVSSILWSHLGRFSAEARKKVHPKNSLYFGKWNFLALRLKKFLYFPEKSVSYISGNGTFLKIISYISGGNFPSSKNLKNPLLKSFLCFGKCNFLVPSLKNFLYFKRELQCKRKMLIILFLIKKQNFLK